jgi:hypothetical protein
MAAISTSLQKKLDDYFGYLSGPKTSAQTTFEGVITSSDSLCNMMNK